MPGFYYQQPGASMRDGNRGAAALPGSARTARPIPGSPRKRIRWLLIVVAVMAILTAGWPLINLAVSNNSRIAANTSLVIGPSSESSARVTVGPGWSMLSEQSNPHMGYVLRRGGVEVSITYVRLIRHVHAADLFTGMRQLVRMLHPGAELSRPKDVTTAHGYEADLGTVRGSGLVGTASVFTDPGRNFAIEMFVIAPLHTVRVNLIAAQRIVRSVFFLPVVR
jgi:hypothetical protein